jgi:hypothetical protein
MLKTRIVLLAFFAGTAGSAAAAGNTTGFSGLLDGNFTYSNDRVGPAVDTDQYTVHGALAYTFDDPGFGVQLDAQDNFYFGTKYDLAHLWTAGGSVFFRDNKGTIGLSGSYFSVDAPAAPIFIGKESVESTGFFGEYYPSRNLTLEMKGGKTWGPLGLASYYGGAGLTYYEAPDLAFHVEGNFTSFTAANNWTDFNASVEYMPFDSIPMSFSAGYDHTLVSGFTGNASTFFAGIKYHFGAGHVLGEYDRTGPVQYTGKPTPGANLKF